MATARPGLYPGTIRRRRRIEALTGYHYDTVRRLAARVDRRASDCTDAELVEIVRAYRQHVRIDPRDPRRPVPCEYCGRVATEKGRTWRYDWDLDAVVCARGKGCSRRKPGHEREARCETGQRTREYLGNDGCWYTLQQIADLAETTQDAAYQRMSHGWTVEDAIRPRERVYERPRYYARLRRALTQALQEAV